MLWKIGTSILKTGKTLLFIRIFVRLAWLFGADSGFDGISEAQGARRGAVGLVNKPQKIVANDEQYALAA